MRPLVTNDDTLEVNEQGKTTSSEDIVSEAAVNGETTRRSGRDIRLPVRLRN